MKETEYKGDQRPCLVARKPCGCYVAACALDEDNDFNLAVESAKEWREWGATLEVRPIAFVLQGGLTFDCEHESVAAPKG